MGRFSILLTLAVTIGSASRLLKIRAEAAPATQVIDATHLRRHSKDEIEIVVVQQARGSGMLTFHLNSQGVVKLDYADWIRLYLSPGRYRFGVVPSYNFGRASFWEMNADVS